MAIGEIYKKLNSDKTSPVGNCYVRKNLKQIEPELDIDNATALKNAGWCFHLNEPQPTVNFHSEYGREWQNQGDVRIGDEADNTWGFNWELVDITSTVSADRLAELQDSALANMKVTRKLLLQRTDWWELPTHTPMSAERTAYRQALRDLPANTSDIFDITWPTPPEDID
jgi:hypothetical protein|tara:strand:- start:113 stop:622 length:510 start_codon:yes stop_codon:yes gene_type:complete